jgi:hypothetical protein
MEIDPHNLPSEVHVLQQIGLQLLQTVEDKDQLLAGVQHQLAQLLRHRYRQKRLESLPYPSKRIVNCGHICARVIAICT